MTQDEKIDASPTKKFFVDMLTRDIDLYDAILDLLDNCVDGVHRATKESHDIERPYEGYWAEIDISDESFTIKDNCGGIPRSLAKDYAFRMGRPDGRLDNDGKTVGIYGIGMKRAIFKMGSKATVRTKHSNDEYEVSISPEWLNNEKNWNLEFESGGVVLEEPGTCIEITNLHRQISEKFTDSDGVKIDLHKAISTHYTYIINKGLSIKICGERVEPKPLTILASEFENYSEKLGILPYIYERQESGVKVRLVVGFMDQAPSEEELDEENEKPKRRAEDAGWTIIANERVVVYKDKTSLTGWGSNRVPNYHNQFISISGVVEFVSDDASKLPINTTKRGLDASSELYLKVRDRMQEGVRIFTQHTNNWKSNKEEEKRLFSSARNVPVRDVASFVPEEEWVRPRGGVDERYFMPHLPKPHGKGVKTRFMRFSKPVSEIEMVAEYLFQNRDVPSSEVAQRCFEMIHEEASEEQ